MRLLLLAFLTIPCFAQTGTLRVFSEFTRIDPFGNIVPQDRGSAQPRHILSPGVPRNAFSSFRIVLTFDKPAKFIIDVGQNPENAVQVTLYKEQFEKHGEQWIPDGLEPVKMPFEGYFGETDIPGQRVLTFWADVWVPGTAVADRIKVEPQAWLSYAGDWFTYPMEVRTMDLILPKLSLSAAALPAVTARSDTAAVRPLKAALCGLKEAAAPKATNVRALIRRNSQQLLAIPRSSFEKNLLTVTKAPSVQSWCAAEPNPAGPEWYLRLRDRSIRAIEQ
jgi:hypothetical protein